MSYLKTINIQHLTSGTNNIVLDANGNMTCAGTISAATPTGGMRNKIINGDMRIDQRNAGASSTIGSINGTYYLDRWHGYTSQASKLSIQQNAGSVTPPAGFSNYMGFTSLSTYAVVSGDYFFFRQGIEGFNASDLAWGTSSAKSATLSFWIRSSLTGTFGGQILSSDSQYCYVYSYTINTANTWEYKTITIPGPTTGNWYTDNRAGVFISYTLASSRLVSSVGWQSVGSGADSVNGQVNIVGTNGATWYITGIQLETGSVATAFERRLHGTELALCQRYYQRMVADADVRFGVGQCISTTQAVIVIPYPVTMRSAPTALEQNGTASNYRLINSSGSGVNGSSVPTFNSAGVNTIGIIFTVASGLTGGNATTAYSPATGVYLGWSAEL